MHVQLKISWDRIEKIGIYCIWFSDLGERVPRRGAEADKDIEKRDGSLSVYRHQRRATSGQQTYFYQRSL